MDVKSEKAGKNEGIVDILKRHRFLIKDK